MSGLLTAAFAAAEGRHLLAAPRSAEFTAFARGFDEAAFRANLQRGGLRWVERGQEGFPRRLLDLHDPPAGLFVRGGGEHALLDRPAVAIVGARSCSDYGAHVATWIARELAGAGIVVVSGLARGIDGAAHRGALRAGVTVAVLGCGIDRDYPRSNAQLAAQVAERGLIVSEYPPGVEPAPWRFPARNRLVAALAGATVVVEARERSGALITADLALDLGRDVLAVPGEITSALSKGTNALLRLGAIPVTGPDDVLEALGIEPRVAEAEAVARIGGQEAAVLGAIADAPAGVDELAGRLALDPAALAAALSRLELAGLVVDTGGVYRRS